MLDQKAFSLDVAIMNRRWDGASNQVMQYKVRHANCWHVDAERIQRRRSGMRAEAKKK
jgi:hypothetical protein